MKFRPPIHIKTVFANTALAAIVLCFLTACSEPEEKVTHAIRPVKLL